jgi:hypothetical protein
MRNSTFIVLSFLGLIFLAASLIWMPLPQETPKTDPETQATVPPPIVLPSANQADPGKRPPPGAAPASGATGGSHVSLYRR